MPSEKKLRRTINSRGSKMATKIFLNQKNTDKINNTGNRNN
ncbi:hypothetical protein HM1_0016 [Heliomicrobium modesticaldum Ice1]|uniref:Uncharacterized protein n=1 Tax=Heliobacterium modesticaldum (strain ATCC 51547 / Ice1) TaxID=498761 RepID=B0THW8_HELMI|nr:hypothetical protein HM1_0016 [Heliomicrobium modesticaldum Ice1]